METSPWVERVQLAFKRVGTVSTLLSTVVVNSEETFFMYVCMYSMCGFTYLSTLL